MVATPCHTTGRSAAARFARGFLSETLRFFYNAVDVDGSEVAFGLNVGCLGPGAGGQPTQTLIHKLFDQPEPLGWRTQIRNEPGLVLRAGARAPYWRLHRHLDGRPGAQPGNGSWDCSGTSVHGHGGCRSSGVAMKLPGCRNHWAGRIFCASRSVIFLEQTPNNPRFMASQRSCAAWGSAKSRAWRH